MIILLGRGMNHITEGTTTTIIECMVSSLGCCPAHMGIPRISLGVQDCGIQASDSFDGYVADGRLSLTSLFKPIARETLHSEHGMRIRMTIISVPRLPLRTTTKFTHLHCPIDRPGEVIRGYIISGTEQRLNRVL
jgi:hypothetical protein